MKVFLGSMMNLQAELQRVDPARAQRCLTRSPYFGMEKLQLYLHEPLIEISTSLPL